MSDNLMDLDLNQEPVDPPSRSVARFGSSLNELETAHGRIEERILQLEAVTARATQRQRWRQARNSMEISRVLGEMTVGVDGERGIIGGNSNMGIVERTVERGKCYKRDSSYLVEKALEMDYEVKKVDKEGGSFYDCNICLDLAREPVLTCCGHMFCWACFYQVSYIDSTSKECPVCKGEVTDSTVIPIYGNGGSNQELELESGLKVPPRPKAHRVESVRQQRVAHGPSHVPVAEALRRIRISIGAMGDQTQQQEGGNSGLNFDSESQSGQNAEATGRHRTRIQQVSRVLSESDASLFPLPSPLSNAEMVGESLETVINNHFARSVARSSSVDVDNPFNGHSPNIQSNNHPPDSTAEINSALPIISSPLSTNISGSVVHILTARNSSEMNMPVALSSSSSSRRRSFLSRILDLNLRDTRESRRRRLN